MSAPIERRETIEVASSTQETCDPRSIACAEDCPPPLIAGRYLVERELGHGGMAQVFLARDLRLKRRVAIKVLSSEVRDVSRLERLEHEARLMGSLGHPNVVEVHDIGSFDGRPYLVEEYLVGMTLRDRLAAGPIPMATAIDIATQIARALVAAHQHDVVHCDVKPENVVVSPEGRVKVLDFGVARLAADAVVETTMDGGSVSAEPRVFRGTVPYSSPEQLRSNPVDARSDVFSLGVVLHEMLAGTRPFAGGTAAEIAAAILHEPPAALPHGIPVKLQQIVRRCLKKDATSRFQSAEQLASDLEGAAHALHSRARRWRDVVLAALVLPSIVGLVVATTHLSRSAGAPPKSRQMTFLPGAIWTARFGPDAETIFYTQAFDGPAPRVHSTRIAALDNQRLELNDGVLLGVSSNGTSAVLSKPSFAGFDFAGTLAIMRPGDGGPRELLERVTFADWSTDGSSLAAVRAAGTTQHLEFPVGKTIWETSGWISEPRVSPDGKRVAFLQHPDFTNAAGVLVVATRDGVAKVLTSRWAHARGLSWSPDGSEIWFTATAEDSVEGTSLLRAARLDGSQRVLLQATADLKLEDVSRGGKVLVTEPRRYLGVAVSTAGADRDLSIRDQQVLHDLSGDGALVLFTLLTDSGKGALFVRRTDGSAPVQIATGYGGALSPDAKWAFVFGSPPTGRPSLVPTGAGEAKLLDELGMTVTRARFFPDGRRVLLIGQQPGTAPRLFVLSLGGGPLRAISDAGVSPGFAAISPNGAQVACIDSRGAITLVPSEGGVSRPVPSVVEGEVPFGWTSDEGLLVGRPLTFPLQIDRVDLSSGRRSAWKTIGPATPGAHAVARIIFSNRLDVFAYSHVSWNTHLYLIDGLH